jgi:uncharacterized membrane protein YbaN (DUF454 family)
LPIKIILLTILGFIFLSFGAIGLFLPVWPTTPFVLLSVACFSSAPRIKAQIMKISFFKEHVENYERRCGLQNKTVLISLIWLWIMMIISMFLVKNLWISILLFIIATAVTIHILWMAKSIDRKEKKTL